DVLLPLGAFAVVELLRVRVAANADERGRVEDALESSVVGDRPVEVAADLARVARCGGDAGEGRQGVRGVELVQAAADGGEELRAEDGADARDTLDYVGEFVLAKPALDELVHLGDPLVE